MGHGLAAPAAEPVVPVPVGQMLACEDGEHHFPGKAITAPQSPNVRKFPLGQGNIIRRPEKPAAVQGEQIGKRAVCRKVLHFGKAIFRQQHFAAVEKEHIVLCLRQGGRVILIAQPVGCDILNHDNSPYGKGISVSIPHFPPDCNS